MQLKDAVLELINQVGFKDRGVGYACYINVGLYVNRRYGAKKGWYLHLRQERLDEPVRVVVGDPEPAGCLVYVAYLYYDLKASPKANAEEWERLLLGHLREHKVDCQERIRCAKEDIKSNKRDAKLVESMLNAISGGNNAI